jgi:hypothetical protein
MDYTTNIYLIWELKINSREKKYFNKRKRGVRQAPMAQVSTLCVRWCPRKKKEASDNKGRENGGIFNWVLIFIFFAGFLLFGACVGVPVSF